MAEPQGRWEAGNGDRGILNTNPGVDEGRVKREATNPNMGSGVDGGYAFPPGGYSEASERAWGILMDRECS